MSISKKHTGYWIDKYVQENTTLKLVERVLLGDIITVHQVSGKYYKSNKRMSLITGLKKRAVQNVLKSLIDKGYINEPKQIRSSPMMTIRRIITPNISFAKEAYQKQLKSLSEELEVSVDNIPEKESRVHISTEQGVFSNTSGCSQVHAKSTLKENNRIQISDNSIQRILSGEETEENIKKGSNENDWFDELINGGNKVNSKPPTPTVIPEDEIESYQKKKVNKIYKADQSGHGTCQDEFNFLRDCIT
jgi:hypothetical protein